MEARESLRRLSRSTREALGELAHPTSDFGRLARVHVLATAGDTLVAVALAGTLFFSISPTAARSHVLLYLVLTMTPFLAVAQVLSPVLDRARDARRSMVVASGSLRALVCLLMAVDTHSLLLFPEAFVVLVASKAYAITKAALVPGTVDSPQGLVVANARLSLLAGLSAVVAGGIGAGVLELLGAPWVLRLDVVVLAALAVGGLRLRPRAPSWVGPPATAPGRPRTTSGPVSSAAAASAGPGGGGHQRPGWLADRRLFGVTAGPLAPSVLVAAAAQGVLRGAVGFTVFLVAFALRRSGASLLLYGVVLLASSAGSLLATVVVPRLRRRFQMTEAELEAGSLLLVAGAGILAGATGGGRLAVIGLALAVGAAANGGKFAFDALVQRQSPELHQGRAFAGFETRFQFAWVIGALVPVAAVIPLVAGSILVGLVSLVAAVSFLTARRALLAAGADIADRPERRRNQPDGPAATGPIPTDPTQRRTAHPNGLSPPMLAPPGLPPSPPEGRGAADT